MHTIKENTELTEPFLYKYNHVAAAVLTIFRMRTCFDIQCNQLSF